MSANAIRLVNSTSTKTKPVDPVIATIERYIRAHARHTVAVVRLGYFESVIPENRRTWHWTVFEEQNPPHDCKDDPAYIAANCEYRDSSREHAEAVKGLVSTVPTSAAGLETVLYFMSNCELTKDEVLSDEQWTGTFNQETREPEYFSPGDEFKKTIRKCAGNLARIERDGGLSDRPH